MVRGIGRAIGRTVTPLLEKMLSTIVSFAIRNAGPQIAALVEAHGPEYLGYGIGLFIRSMPYLIVFERMDLTKKMDWLWAGYMYYNLIPWDDARAWVRLNTIGAVKEFIEEKKKEAKQTAVNWIMSWLPGSGAITGLLDPGDAKGGEMLPPQVGMGAPSPPAFEFGSVGVVTNAQFEHYLRHEHSFMGFALHDRG
jgi:hypothetical protein